MNAELLAKHRDDIFAVDVKTYPGGEPLITHAGPVEKILLRPRSLLTFAATMFWVEAMRDRGHAPPVLLLPYIPGARQDRLNDEGDQLFTLKSVARMINAAGFREVRVFDPHSDVAAALIDRCVVMDYKPRLIGTYVAVIAPDAGAGKRASEMAKHIGVPLLQAWKRRDVTTGKIAGFGLEPTDIRGRVFVVDDICDGGGTFLGLADELAKQGLEADLFVTHGIFSQGTAKLLSRYTRIFCTDSVIADRPGVEVSPVCFDTLKWRRK